MQLEPRRQQEESGVCLCHLVLVGAGRFRRQGHRQFGWVLQLFGWFLVNHGDSILEIRSYSSTSSLC